MLVGPYSFSWEVKNRDVGPCVDVEARIKAKLGFSVKKQHMGTGHDLGLLPSLAGLCRFLL